MERWPAVYEQLRIAEEQVAKIPALKAAYDTKENDLFGAALDVVQRRQAVCDAKRANDEELTVEDLKAPRFEYAEARQRADELAERLEMGRIAALEGEAQCAATALVSQASRQLEFIPPPHGRSYDIALRTFLKYSEHMGIPTSYDFYGLGLMLKSFLEKRRPNRT